MGDAGSSINSLPIVWQMILGLLTFAGTVGGVTWAFWVKYSKPEPSGEQRVILERAELADLAVLRELAREFRPALERLIHIDTVVGRVDDRHTHFEEQVREMLAKLDRMERAAQVAKEVREQLAMRMDRQERATGYREG
jgi:hypothetical protein